MKTTLFDVTEKLGYLDTIHIFQFSPPLASLLISVLPVNSLSFKEIENHTVNTVQLRDIEVYSFLA